MKKQNRIRFLEKDLKIAIKEKKRTDFIIGIIMLVSLGFLLLGLNNYAIVGVLLSALGLSVSSSMNTRIRLLEHDLDEAHFDNILIPDEK